LVGDSLKKIFLGKKFLVRKIPCLKISWKKNSSEKKFLARKIPCFKFPWKKISLHGDSLESDSSH
jgi:hypothetical protein